MSTPKFPRGTFAGNGTVIHGALRAAARVESLKAQGFTVPTDRPAYCDSCAAVSINGIPAHETGCPNSRHECAGCNALVPVRVKYCEDCA